MAWTFTDDPEHVPRDAVRVLCGDADENNQKLSDNQIAFFISQNEDNNVAAAADAAEAIAAHYADMAAVHTGDLGENLTSKHDAYLKIAARLRARSEDDGPDDTDIPAPFAGGVSREPMFYRGVGYRTRDTTDYSTDTS